MKAESPTTIQSSVSHGRQYGTCSSELFFAPIHNALPHKWCSRVPYGEVLEISCWTSGIGNMRWILQALGFTYTSDLDKERIIAASVMSKLDIMCRKWALDVPHITNTRPYGDVHKWQIIGNWWTPLICFVFKDPSIRCTNLEVVTKSAWWQ